MYCIIEATGKDRIVNQYYQCHDSWVCHVNQYYSPRNWISVFSSTDLLLMNQYYSTEAVQYVLTQCQRLIQHYQISTFNIPTRLLLHWQLNLLPEADGACPPLYSTLHMRAVGASRAVSHSACDTLDFGSDVSGMVSRQLDEGTILTAMGADSSKLHS